MLLSEHLTTQIDSKGNTVLHHMCSHNSPIIPIYLEKLKKHDPLLNWENYNKHTPLAVAGMYCQRTYIDMLKAKGAIDDGTVDYWAVVGANREAWSG